jgi:hypothetical protein
VNSRVRSAARVPARKIAHLGGLGPEQHGQRRRVVAVAGQRRLEGQGEMHLDLQRRA